MKRIAILMFIFLTATASATINPDKELMAEQMYQIQCNDD